jgi:FG-GAP-like repeat/FG-GAP repeat
MTWHLAAQRRAWAVVLTAMFVTACGSSGSKRAQIELLEPMDMAELTIDDDQDPDLPGVQYEVRAQTRNIRPKTVMLLVIPGEIKTVAISEVDEDGLVVFEKATLPPGRNTFQISSSTASVTSEEYSYTLKTLVIQSPKDGSNVAFGDDTDQDTEGLQINVTVKAYTELNEDITLTVDGEQVGDPISPDMEGVAVFRGVTLATGTRTLKATSGDVESGETKVSVNEACASVTFVTPEVPESGDRLTLGGGDRCPSNGQDFTVDFVISTDAGEGRDVELTVNNTTKQKAKVSGALAKFEGVVLNRRMSANEVSVTVQGAGGVTCAPVPYPKDIFVDCEGSDCTIGSPVPYSGEDANGDPAFYLNKSMLNGDGFDIRVDSDQGVIGKQLQLIIDGRDGRNALFSDAVPNGNRLSATFSTVKLSQGVHTIEGRCTDDSGNITESGELTWVVDTDACEVTIEEPAANALIVPGNDSDMDSANGVMLPVKATIEGSDCTGSRTATCNAANGIEDGDYSTIVNGSIDTTVTLSSGADQTICVEALDRANNIGRGTAAVKYRSVVPSVSIEAPANDASYNKLGDDMHSADTDPNTAACNADFQVACTELGGTVQLHRTDENGPVIASGTCEAQANGDPAIPSGFNGRAKIPNVSFLAPGVDNATIVATQTVAGNSNQTLTGKSAPISLTGWCDLPQVGLTPNCPPEQMELPMSGNAIITTQNANFSGPIPARAPESGTASVTVASTGDPIGGVVPAMLSGTLYQFMNIDLGNTEQTVNVKFDFTDDYGNTTSRTCPVTLVADLPVVTIDDPSTGLRFGPAGGCTPNPAAPDKYGIDVDVTLDQTAMRELGYRVNGGALVPVTITGTSMSLCVPVSDGLSTIAVELKSTIGAGLSKPSIDVDVDMINVTAPGDDEAFLPADDACDPGFGANVSADVASTFEGAAFTVNAGVSPVTGTVTGGQINTCVPLNSGANTITVSLDGKNVSRTVDVTVVGAAPMNSIPITTVNVPSGGSFRTGTVSLGWDAPQQDYPGQLKNYELRCQANPIQMSDTDQAKNDWWAAARPIALAGGVVPPATSSTAGLRVGDNVHCVLRGRDAGDQLTPIGSSTQVNYSFREVSIEVPELNRLGYAIAPVGDVNDDGVGDVLIGGTGRAYLLFGGSNVTSKTAPDVTFVGNSGALASYEFGTRVTGIGDVNGDGTNDFAIAHPTLSVAAPVSVGYVGAVYVFYGRKANDPWPTSIDLTGIKPDMTGPSALECGADVCFYGENTGDFLGFALAPAGDFDADGRPDIALSAPNHGAVGRLYVVMGRAFQSGGSRPTSFWNVAIRLPSGDPIGFYVDGAGATGTDATSSKLLGQAVSPVGNGDGMAGADLLVTSGGDPYSAKLHFLSGRANDGLAPRLKAIATSDLVLKDTGAASQFGRGTISLRNWYDNGSSGAPDVGVFYASGDAFNVYLGDNSGGSTFSNASRITVAGPPSSAFANLGRNVARGYNPNLGGGSISDIDGDGLDDLCVGTAPASGTTPIYVFYGSDLAANLSSNLISYTKASQINPTARTGATSRTVQPVGDITGDGKVDVIVGEPNANSQSGGITVLY